MLRRLIALFAVMGGAGPAAAQDIVATLHSHNGTLPPPYHRSTGVTIMADGLVTVRVCKGYDDSGAACKTFTGRAGRGAVEAILNAARTAGLPGRPMGEDPMPPVGGGATSGTVHLDGQIMRLPPFPLEVDRGRTESVLTAISQAIPADLQAQAAE